MPINREPKKKTDPTGRGRGNSGMGGSHLRQQLSVQDLRTLGSRQMQQAMRERGFHWVQGQGWVKGEPQKGNRK